MPLIVLADCFARAAHDSDRSRIAANRDGGGWPTPMAEVRSWLCVSPGQKGRR